MKWNQCSRLISGLCSVTFLAMYSLSTVANAEDFFSVRNAHTLPDRLPAQRIPLGLIDDYKPCVALLLSGELLVVAFDHQILADDRILENMTLLSLERRRIIMGRAEDSPADGSGTVFERAFRWHLIYHDASVRS